MSLMPKFKLEKRGVPPVWFQIVMPVAAVFIALAISAIFLLIIKKNPFEAFYNMFVGSLGTKFALSETIVKATPLILTGVAVAIAFKAKYWNIGAEGQLYAGALAATWFGIMNLPLPAIIYIPLKSR